MRDTGLTDSPLSLISSWGRWVWTWVNRKLLLHHFIPWIPSADVCLTGMVLILTVAYFIVVLCGTIWPTCSHACIRIWYPGGMLMTVWCYRELTLGTAMWSCHDRLDVCTTALFQSVLIWARLSGMINTFWPDLSSYQAVTYWCRRLIVIISEKWNPNPPNPTNLCKHIKFWCWKISLV